MTKLTWPETLAHELKTYCVPMLLSYAENLKLATDGLLVGRVTFMTHHTSHRTDLDETLRFQYRFEMVAPLLDQYFHPLFIVSFGVDPYPASINPLNHGVIEEIGKVMVAHDEAEFVDILKRISHASTTIKIARTLIANIKALI